MDLLVPWIGYPVLFVIVFITFLILSKHKYLVDKIASGIFWAGFVILVWFFIVLNTSSHRENISRIESYSVVAIRTYNDIEGSFVFSCGSIKSNMIYRCYPKVGIAIRAMETPAHKTYIYEDVNPEDARVDIIYGKHKKSFWSLFDPYYNCEWVLSYEFHVPEGAVLHTFNIK